MNNNSIQIYEPEHFGNGWGFYVDIETPHTTNSKFGFIKENYHKIYYNCHDKIDEELEYYGYDYNKRQEENLKQLEDININKKTSALLYHISSLTLVTAALSYCFICAL